MLYGRPNGVFTTQGAAILSFRTIKFTVCSGLAIVAVLLLFVGGPDDYSLRSLRAIWGLGHLLCFGLLAYLYVSWRGNVHFWRLSIEVVTLTILVGGVTELVQSYVGRTPLWTDLVEDILGAMVGLVFLSKSRYQLSAICLKVLQGLVLLLVIPSLLPFGRSVIDEVIALGQFPLLSGFETGFERSRFSGNSKLEIVKQPAFSGKKALKVELNTNKYSGATLKYFPRDWSSFNAVTLKLYHEDIEPLVLNLRIHDIHHNQEYNDRYNSRFILEQGWNQIEIALTDVSNSPTGRQIDLSRIGGLGFFVMTQEKPRVLIVDDVQLVLK